MQRSQLEHIIRASAAITGAETIVIVGSQAILGQFPEAPPELLLSMEADVFSFRDPADADLIEGSIGEGSPFHQTFGYFAHGVGEDTAILPAAWKERLVRIRNENTGGGAGCCPEIHDLTISKLIAGREKDLEFVRAVLRHHLADAGLLKERLASTPISEERRAISRARIERLAEPG